MRYLSYGNNATQQESESVVSNNRESAKQDLVEFYGESMLYPANKDLLDRQIFSLVMWRTMCATSHYEVKYFHEFLNTMELVRQFDRLTEGVI